MRSVNLTNAARATDAGSAAAVRVSSPSVHGPVCTDVSAAEPPVEPPVEAPDWSGSGLADGLSSWVLRPPGGV
jgi:hypothetical protein